MHSTKHFPFSLQQAALTQELTTIKSQVEDLQREKVKDGWDYGMVYLKKKSIGRPKVLILWMILYPGCLTHKLYLKPIRPVAYKDENLRRKAKPNNNLSND